MKTALVDVDLDLPVQQEQIDRIFTAQMQYRDLARKATASDRIAHLKSLSAWIVDHRPEIRQALHDDFMKPEPEVELSEIWTVLTDIKHTIRNIRRWMKPTYVRPTLASFSTRSKIYYEPRGTVLIISPWNYPFTLTLQPLVSALTAGNTCILKPSEFSPNTSALMAKMVDDLFPEELVSLFEGDRHTAQALLNKPFDHIYFTGSPGTGKEIMKAAAQHLSSVTLELGGKSPVIIHESANLDYAAKQIVWGKFINCGQTCISPDYLLVHRSIYDIFLEKLQNEIFHIYGRDPDSWESFPDLARIITDHHFDRLQKMLDQSVAAGARVLLGGNSNRKTRYFPPTILIDAPESSPVLTEEIFGPILPLLPFGRTGDALDIIKRRPRPLALYTFSRDRSFTERILNETSAGGTCVNDVVLHFLQLNLPFGGVKESGHGHAHGVHGFKTFSHQRAVLRHQPANIIRFLGPPYSAPVRKLIRFIARYI